MKTVKNEYIRQTCEAVRTCSLDPSDSLSIKLCQFQKAQIVLLHTITLLIVFLTMLEILGTFLGALDAASDAITVIDKFTGSNDIKGILQNIKEENELLQRSILSEIIKLRMASGNSEFQSAISFLNDSLLCSPTNRKNLLNDARVSFTRAINLYESICNDYPDSNLTDKLFYSNLGLAITYYSKQEFRLAVKSLDKCYIMALGWKSEDSKRIANMLGDGINSICSKQQLDKETDAPFYYRVLSNRLDSTRQSLSNGITSSLLRAVSVTDSKFARITHSIPDNSSLKTVITYSIASFYLQPLISTIEKKWHK